MLAINCLGDYSPNSTDECKIPVKQAKAYVTKVQEKSKMLLLGGVSGWNPDNHEVFRTWWLPSPSGGREGFILHYVPAKQICETMTVDEYEEHRKKEKRHNNRDDNSTGAGKLVI